MSGEDKDKAPKFKIEQTEDYLTMYIGESKAPDPKKEEKEKRSIEVLTQLLLQRENSQMKVDALRELKSEAGKEMLLKAIALSKDTATIRVLTAACWEAGHDFSRFVSFFAQLAVMSSFDICLEVLTVMEDMQGPFEKKMLEASLLKLREEVKKADQARSELILDMILALERHL
jgi:hypothetical protein